MYAFEGGLKLRTRKLAGSLLFFDLELHDAIARRTAIFPDNIVGTSIAGYTVVAQDTDGRAYVAVDPRPIVTRVNVERGRIQGVEGDVQVRLGREWIGNANVSLANGRDGDDVYLRRMPPVMGVLRLKWEPSVQPFWAEAVVTAAGTQDRLSPGDLSDARIGARRRRADIAGFFNGTAVDLGLVQGGRLIETGESLADVQARLLNGADATYLYTETPGFVVFSLAWRLACLVTPRHDGDARQRDGPQLPLARLGHGRAGLLVGGEGTDSPVRTEDGGERTEEQLPNPGLSSFLSPRAAFARGHLSASGGHLSPGQVRAPIAHSRRDLTIQAWHRACSGSPA